MIKESCSCGAQIEIDFGRNNPIKESNAIERWRENHQHQAPQTVAREVPKVLSGTGTLTAWTKGKDYVLNGDGEPVWVGEGQQPKAFTQWASSPVRD